MAENKHLSIPIEKVLFSSLDDDRISKLTFKLMHSSQNKNGSDITLDALNYAINTKELSIVGQPILAAFTKDDSDFKEHNEEEQIIGLIPEINNNLRLEKEEDTDRTYVYCDGYIYTNYSRSALELFEKSKDKSYGCSVEIEILDGYMNKDTEVYMITKFKFLGVTILSHKYETGMYNTSATLTYALQDNFKEKLQELNSILNLYFSKKDEIGTGEKIDIDLSEESADKDTVWSDVDKTQLRNDLLKASNYKTLIKKCYLVVDDNWEDTPSLNLHYPVCMIKDNTLVLSVNGCQSAWSMLQKETDTDYYKSAKAKLKKYYKVLDLDISTFNINNKNREVKVLMNKKKIAEKFSLTYEQLENELRRELSEVNFETTDWNGCQYLCQRYYLEDYDDSFVYAYDYQEDIDCKIPYAKNGDSVSLDFEKTSRVKFSPVDFDNGNSSDEGDDEEVVVENFAKKMVSDLNIKFAEFAKQQKTELDKKSEDVTKFTSDLETANNELDKAKNDYIELTKKFNALQETVNAKETEITNLNTQIETFNNSEKTRLEDEKASKANILFTENATLLSEDEVSKFTEKLKTFEKYEDFEKEVKCFLFDKAKEKNKNVKTDLNFSYTNNPKIDNGNKEKDQNKNLWSKYSEEYNK